MKGTAVPGEKEGPRGERVPGSCPCGLAQLGWEAQFRCRAGARLSRPPPGPLQCPVSAPGAAFQPRCPRTRARVARAHDAERGPCCPAQAAARSFSLGTWCWRSWARDWRCRTPAALAASCSCGSGSRTASGVALVLDREEMPHGEPTGSRGRQSPAKEDGTRAPRGPGLGHGGGQGHAAEWRWGGQLLCTYLGVTLPFGRTRADLQRVGRWQCYCMRGTDLCPTVLASHCTGTAFWPTRSPAGEEAVSCLRPVRRDSE